MKAFWEAFEKHSAARSEILNTLLNPGNAIGNLPGAVAGAIAGPRSKEDHDKINKKSWSNMIPGVAPYRLTRRAMGTK